MPKEISVMRFNTRMFNYQFFGPTNTRGARVKIEDKYFDRKIFVSFDYEVGNAAVQAALFLEDLGFKIQGFNDEYQIIIAENWDSHIQLTWSCMLSKGDLNARKD